MKSFLHLGCGFRDQKQTTSLFSQSDWKEIRIDIDKAVMPDIVASVTDLSPVPSESAEAAYLSHVIEHVYAHQVQTVLREVLRVIKPDGFALFRCPDLQGIAAIVAEDRLNDTLYDSLSEGPITPHDIIYGHSRSLARGEFGMAHRCGFTARSLLSHLNQAGFNSCIVSRRGRSGVFLELWGLASRAMLSQEEMAEMLGQHSNV